MGLEEPDYDPYDNEGNYYDEDAEYERKKEEEMEYKYEKEMRDKEKRKESEENRSEVYDNIIKYFKIQLEPDDLPVEWYFKPVESTTDEERNIIKELNGYTKLPISMNEVLGLMGFINKMIKRCEEHSKPEIEPNIMKKEIDLDDWFGNDVNNFAREAIKTFKLIEEDDAINTNRVDKIILDLCNSIFQALYREVVKNKNEAL